MLEAIQLTKQYGSHLALDRLDLKVEPGEVFCLLGANGAGKTTTINLFLNFVDPTSGKALINGVDVTADPVGTKRFVSYIPEHVMLYRHMTGLENLEYFTGLIPGAQYSNEQLTSLLRTAGLPEEATNRRVEGYSKGMRQKVGLAIAAAKNAKALLLDEPTSGLDPKASNTFSESIAEMSTKGVAILMATHDLFRAKESGTRIGIMRDGVLREILRCSEISHSELEQLYLHHMN
jgi:ABC-2 type transport system ATP-binding protein